jgi:hypothetical protein
LPIFFGAKNCFAGIDGTAKQLTASPTAIEQQAEQGRLADLLRGRQERDAALGNHFLPNPGNSRSLLSYDEVGMSNRAVGMVSLHGQNPNRVCV